MIRSGQLSCAGEVQAMMDFASHTVRHIRRSETTATAVHFGPDGRPLDEDGELVRNMGDPEAWKLTPERQGVLDNAISLFIGKQTELDMPVADLPLASALRSELALILGLDNPYKFTFNQLAEIAGRYVSLSRQVLPKATPVKSSLAIAPRSVTTPVEPLEPPVALPVQAHPPLPRQRRTTDFAVIPGALSTREIRSHRRPPGKGLRALGRVAVATVAAASIFAGGFLINASVNSNKPNQAPPTAKAYVPPPEALIPPLPITELDHTLSIGGPYDPLKRTGAIQYVVEKGAAALGYPNLTPAQTHKITSRTLRYMDERLPGGMSWAKARSIRPGTMLPFPPPEVLRQWIQETLGKTADQTD